MKRQKNEDDLRHSLKRFVKTQANNVLHVSWVESHATAIGIPDVSYCCRGTEGWIEMKAGPGLEVRAAQVLWMEARILAGGHPLILIEWGGDVFLCHGVWSGCLRAEPSKENIERLSSRRWADGINEQEFLTVLQCPESIYDITQ